MERIDRLLFEASIEGNATSLLILLQEDPLILDRMTLSFSDDAPLHVASMLGHVDFVKEILGRKPELASEFNPERYLPLHIASAKGHVEVVKALVSANPDTCLVCDRDGRNPLHLAAIRGRDEVLKELVRIRPHAARAVAQNDETILHLCVRHNQLESLKFLVETMEDHEFLNSKDVDGNTILHLAVADKQLETINFLLLNTTIEMNASNANGETAMDLLARGQKDRKDVQIMNSLERMGLSEPRRESSLGQVPKNARRERFPFSLPSHSQKDSKNHDDWLENKRNCLMVVASLIAKMAFHVRLQGHFGGVNPNQKSHEAGFAVMAYKHPDSYNNFLVYNTVGFVSSLGIILLFISGLPFFRRRVVMWILMVSMWVATSAMTLAYMVSISVVTLTPGGSTFKHILLVRVLVWLGLSALLLIGHAIRIIVKGVRKLWRLVFSSQRRVLRVQL